MLIINKYSCYRLWLSLLHLDTPISFKCSCVLVDNTNHTKSTTTFGSSPNRLCFPMQQSFILLLSYWLSVFFFCDHCCKINNHFVRATHQFVMASLAERGTPNCLHPIARFSPSSRFFTAIRSCCNDPMLAIFFAYSVAWRLSSELVVTLNDR